MEFSYFPAGLDLCILPPNFLLHLSVHLSDFVAGVPKGLMLYGSVRKLNCHLHLWAFRVRGHGTDMGEQTKENGLSAIVTVGDCIIHTY